MSPLNDGMYTRQVKKILYLFLRYVRVSSSPTENCYHLGAPFVGPCLQRCHMCSSRNTWTPAIFNFFMVSDNSLRAQPDSFIMLVICEMALSALRKRPGLFRRTALLSLSSVSLYLTKLTVGHYIIITEQHNDFIQEQNCHQFLR